MASVISILSTTHIAGKWMAMAIPWKYTQENHVFVWIPFPPWLTEIEHVAEIFEVSLNEPTVFLALELRVCQIGLRIEGHCIFKCGLGHRRRRRTNELGRVSYNESTRFSVESTRFRCNVPAVAAGFNNSDIS